MNPSFTVTIKSYPDARRDEDDYREVTIKSYAVELTEVLEDIEAALRAVGYCPKGTLDFVEET